MKNLLFFLVLIANAAFAQFKQKESYTVYVNYPDYTVKAVICNTDKKVEAKETLTYYWYSSNKILQTKGGYEGKILDGAYTSFYISNNLKEKGSFKGGLKNGQWITWYENGKINEIVNWKKGLKHGTYKQFDNNDHLTCEATYKNNELNGLQMNYENGKEIRKVKYKNGVEVIEKPKKEKAGKEADKAVDADKSKKTFKQKITSVFKKKDKKETIKKSPEKKQTPPAEKKPEKTFKEKINSVFKKKDTGSEPKKTVKLSKQEKENKQVTVND